MSTGGLILYVIVIVCVRVGINVGKPVLKSQKKILVVLELLIEKKYSCKLVRAWRGIISVSFHTHRYILQKPICLHLPTILPVNKVVRPYDIVMNKVKVLNDPLNPLLETSF